jgi:hypothetical protein
MKKITSKYLFLLLILCLSCKHERVQISKKTKVVTEDLNIIPIDETSFTTIKIKKTENKTVPASSIIEDFRYIPIETGDESLLDYYSNVRIYKNRIYILNMMINNSQVFIFDMNGKYINQIGVAGQGPGEYVKLYDFIVNPYEDQLVVSDNMRRKLHYYSLDGTSLEKEIKVSFSISDNFCYVNSNRLVFALNKSDSDFQPQKWNDYRIFYTDTTMNILGVSMEYDDNVHSQMGFKQFKTNGNNEVLYNPLYKDDYFLLTPDILKLKYRIDYSDLDPININEILKLDNGKELWEYWLKHTHTCSPLLETKEGLFFMTTENNAQNHFYTYYEKRSGKSISMNEIKSDNSFFFNSIITTHGDYFVGIVGEGWLKTMQKIYLQENRKMDPAVNEMINNLQEFDNDVLVLFKFKSLEK